MHVLIVNEYALPAGAAGITRHGDLGLELVKRGHRVTVIASRLNYLTKGGGEADPAVEIVDGVTFRWLRTGSYAGNDASRVRSMIIFALRSALAGIRMRHAPDVVIGSSPQLLAGLSALAIALRFRVPFVFEVRDPWPSALVDLGALRRDGLANRSLELLERLLYRRAATIIAVMEHVDRRVREVGEDPGKCVFIPNASRVPPELRELPARLASELQIATDAGRTVFLYAGAHGVSNGLHEVIDALDLLRVSMPGTYDRLALFFVGDGPEKEALQKRASGHQHVHFHASIPKPVMLAAMDRADFVLVHFARAEFKRYGMSANKLFDAMAVGTPVLLASPLRDTPTDTAGCGIRYDPGSIGSLADALVEATQMPLELRQLMGRRGREEAARSYDLKVTARELEVQLDRLLPNGPS